jgi:hypothetical protein
MIEPIKDCPFRDQDDIEGSYLAGALSPADAEDFERHYFECDECWSRVQRAAEIRSALADPANVGRSDVAPIRRKRAVRPWAGSLAAAAVVLLAVGIWRSREIPRSPSLPPSTVMRGAARSINVASHTASGMLIAAWGRTPSASSYRVRLLSADGSLVYERETKDTSLVLGDSVVMSGSALPLFWEIQALNELRNVVAASTLTPVISK